MSIEAQVEEVFETVELGHVHPHIAERIEPGAILYSSWGYDQTNVDYYMVTRATKASAWIVPMRHVEATSRGYSPMSGHTTPLEPMDSETVWVDGEHGRVPVERPIVPAMHRIKRYTYGGELREVLRLTSYSSASLWDGRALYASHYH